MDIISIIAGLLKGTKSLMEFEEQIKILMQKVFTQWVGDVFEEHCCYEGNLRFGLYIAPLV
ncbi:hypothetical protein [Weizmannia sp. CD-2023]|uniref:hypothetical protein n=1 Tax=Weizmannia sp. CD-2023 TaxID=3037263 RepID=UPI002DB85522|nr:hypothetical protein [Weizmannia sp. CD-2023]MEC2306702.1 hypothetical protein [Weizmannia sp. CD-2023]